MPWPAMNWGIDQRLPCSWAGGFSVDAPLRRSHGPRRNGTPWQDKIRSCKAGPAPTPAMRVRTQRRGAPGATVSCRPCPGPGNPARLIECLGAMAAPQNWADRQPWIPSIRPRFNSRLPCPALDGNTPSCRSGICAQQAQEPPKGPEPRALADDRRVQRPLCTLIC
jgi:hypothetical protein